MPKMRSCSIFLAFAALATALLPTSVAHANPYPPPPVPVLNWASCDDDFQCATATVPLGYHDPTGATIQIAVIRHLATDPAHRIGSLFFNPGGPGGSGTLNLPVYFPRFPAALQADFDVVSFDPRGIQASTPVQCLPTAQDEAALLSRAPAGFPVGAAQQQTWINVFSEFGADCGANTGPVLNHLSTANVARDMDLLRQAVGDAKLNYLAPSYGTYLGATYANLFPTKVRAMELESNVDPAAWNSNGSTLGTFLRQGSDIGSAQTLAYFVNQCGLVDTTRCAFSASSPAATMAKFAALLARLRSAPIVLAGVSETYASVLSQVDGGLYFTQAVPEFGIPGYPDTATFLQSLYTAPASSHRAPRAAAARPMLLGPSIQPTGQTPGFEPSATGGQNGVLCTDSPNSPSPNSYATQAMLATDRSGPIGALWAWAAEPCSTWPAPLDPDRYTGPWNVPTSAPILVAGITNDPATPYQSSVNLSRELANARLLTVNGSGHDLFFNRSSCADADATAYFLNGTLPPVGATCTMDAPPF